MTILYLMDIDFNKKKKKRNRCIKALCIINTAYIIICSILNHLIN